jgi:NTP pyrophosphatase (non-canonical NTP hydrolase)
MNNINLNELRDIAYKTACEHGFHDKELSDEHFLCLIVGELMEAVEADRKGKRADRESFKSSYENEEPHDDVIFKYCFEKYIKDTISDELSDAVIRLLDLAGLRGISLESASNDINSEYIDDIACMYSQLSFTEAIYSIFIKPIVDYKYLSTIINEIIFLIFAFAKHLDIDLLWHIEQKMRYNELRPKFHGKKY